MGGTAQTLLNSLEIHPSGSVPDPEAMAGLMVGLAVSTGVPVAWVSRRVVASHNTSVETLTKAIEENA